LQAATWVARRPLKQTQQKSCASTKAGLPARFRPRPHSQKQSANGLPLTLRPNETKRKQCLTRTLGLRALSTSTARSAAPGMSQRRFVSSPLGTRLLLTAALVQLTRLSPRTTTPTHSPVEVTDELLYPTSKRLPHRRTQRGRREAVVCGSIRSDTLVQLRSNRESRLPAALSRGQARVEGATRDFGPHPVKSSSACLIRRHL
jgi:hypothetical protein